MTLAIKGSRPAAAPLATTLEQVAKYLADSRGADKHEIARVFEVRTDTAARYLRTLGECNQAHNVGDYWVVGPAPSAEGERDPDPFRHSLRSVYPVCQVRHFALHDAFFGQAGGAA